MEGKRGKGKSARGGQKSSIKKKEKKRTTSTGLGKESTQRVEKKKKKSKKKKAGGGEYLSNSGGGRPMGQFSTPKGKRQGLKNKHRQKGVFFKPGKEERRAGFSGGVARGRLSKLGGQKSLCPTMKRKKKRLSSLGREEQPGNSETFSAKKSKKE